VVSSELYIFMDLFPVVGFIQLMFLVLIFAVVKIVIGIREKLGPNFRLHLFFRLFTSIFVAIYLDSAEFAIMSAFFYFCYTGYFC